MTVDVHSEIDGGQATHGAEAARAAQGVIAGGARLLTELLRTPRVAKTARIVLQNLDPEAAPELVRTLIFQDTVLFFDLMSASPALMNASVLGAREALRQIAALPEALVDRFLPKILAELDAAALGATGATFALTAVKLLGRPNPALARAAAGFGEGLARGFREALEAEGQSAGGLAEAAVGGLLALSAVAARHGEALAADDRIAAAVGRLAEELPRIAAAHPNLMSRLVGPLAGALREALEGV